MLTLLLPLFLAAAPPAGGASALDRCIDRAAGSDSATSLCLDTAFRDADKRLNAAYRKSLRRAPTPRARRQLRNSEREWLKTRYKRCERDMRREIGNSPPGTLDMLSFRFCGLNEVEQRIVRLNRWTY